MEYQTKSEILASSVKTNVKLPLIIWIVFFGNILAFFGGQVLGYRLTGWGWFIPFCASLLILSGRIYRSRIKFPFLLWLPWIIVVLSYLLDAEFPALQRSIQMLCPIVIGMTVSTYNYTNEQLRRFLILCQYFSVFLIFTVILRSGIIFIGATLFHGFSGHVMTAVLLCSIYATGYYLGNKSYLKWWCFMAFIPVFAITRTAIIVAGFTLPLSFGHMKLTKRLLFLVIICLLGLALFYTPRMQHKMFETGEGEISDVLNKDFKDNARFYMWELFDEQIKRKPWFGHGAGAGEFFVRKITFGVAVYPHNDWRLTLYDYGIFGMSIYVLCLSLAAIYAYRKSKIAEGENRLLFLSGASAFIPFAILMYTDNIMVYVSYFGNLHFTILGLAYASLRKQTIGQRYRLRF